MTNRRNNLAGFTLLEMLAATAMVAVLSASLYASLRIAFKARDAALRSVDVVRKANFTLDILTADLQSARIPSSTTNALAPEFTGSGGEGMMGAGTDSLLFYSAVVDSDPQDGTGEVKMIEYFCQADDSAAGQWMLVRNVTSNLLAPQTPVPQQEILCRGIQSFTLQYYDGETWQTSWDSTSLGYTLPQAVEVTLQLKDVPGNEGGFLSRVILIPCGMQTASSTTDTTQ